jgi:Protein of unknown function (DUF2958).
MKLLTRKIRKRLPKLYGTENVHLEEKIVHSKLFTPDSSWSWFILEGQEQEDGDVLMFAWVIGLEREFGYVSLRELESVRGPLGLPIERDLHFKPRPLKEVMAFHGESM